MMRKKLISLIVLVLLVVGTGVIGYGQDYENVEKRKRFFIKADMGFLMSADSQFKDIYGSSQPVPRLSAGFKFGRFFVWAGYGFFSANGSIPDYQLETKTTQSFIYLGVGFQGSLTRKMDYQVALSLVRAGFDEEALGLTYSASTQGFGFEGGVLYNFGRSLFLEVSIGYISATEILEDRQAKIGGLRPALGLGLRF